MTFPDSEPVPPDDRPPPEAEPQAETGQQPVENKVREVGGRRDGTDPTRYGDWEKGGRCIDF